MRVIAGTAKGTRLFVPQNAPLRPTTDRCKQILFDTLISIPFSAAAVLDAFAGTGAVGIEALSRGAREAFFIEKIRSVAQVLERNLEKTHLKPYAKVIVADAFLFLRQKAWKKFDLIFLDPPYEKFWGEKVIKVVLEKGWLADSGICVLEESTHGTVRFPQGIDLVQRKQSGDSTLYFLKKI